MSKTPPKIIFIFLASVALGVWAFIQTQAIAKRIFEPTGIADACQSKDYADVDDFVTQTGLRAYDKRVGLVVLEPFICLLTQLMHQLVEQYPAGWLSWGATMNQFPILIAMYLEAGRQGSKGLLLWPTFVFLLFQLLGISVVIPLLWVPSYCIWGNKEGGAVSLTRARTVFWIGLVLPIFTILTFLVYPSDSEMWATCAGILTGPVACLPGLVMGMDKAPRTISKENAIRSAETSALAYGIAGILALLWWFYIVYTALLHYGLDLNALVQDVWFEAPPAVQFMTFDGGVLWLGMLLYIGSKDLKRMLEAIVTTVFFGPGAAFAMALASIEMDAAPQWTVNDQGKKET